MDPDVVDRPEPFDLLSADVAAGRRELLRAAFPEVFTEGGKVDFDRLRLALGETVDAGRERYGLNWPGKAGCFNHLQTPSRGALRPDRAGSVGFDATGNVIIEGDNLETLKLLQKAYGGKVKMIYIDPPYNTGNDFIYPDDYAENLETYLRYTGQTDAEGRRFSTNPETDGRFHSRWLNMMYPRLYLARDLLRDDGVIFVSISDSEVSNLRAICDEVFGEDCFVAQFVWNNEGNVDNQSKIKIVHEYILCYSKFPDGLRRPDVIDYNIEETSKLYNDKIENSITKNGPANPPSKVTLPIGFPATFVAGTISAREDAWPKIITTIKVESSVLVESAIVESGWSSKNLLELFINNGCQPIQDSEGKQTEFALTETGAIYIYKKRSDSQGHVLSVIRNVGTTKQNSNALAIWGIEFSYPKPVLLIRYLVEIATRPSSDDLVLDFFAGSGTTAHAVLELNAQDGGNRRFLLVQLPEPTGRTDLPTISEICRERVRRVLARLNEADAGRLPLTVNNGNGTDPDAPATPPDRGFRAYRLDTSGFRPWDGRAAPDAAALRAQLELHVDHLLPDRSADDLLAELLLKSGWPLTEPVETLSLPGGTTVHRVQDGALVLCLDRTLTAEGLRSIALLQPTPARVVCLDAGFAGDDALKTNAVQTMRSRGVTRFQTV